MIAPISVVIAALVTAILLSAANVTNVVHLLSHPTENALLLDVPSKALVWMASLNKPVAMIAYRMPQDPAVSEGMRLLGILGATFGVTTGSISGCFLALWTYGRAVERGGYSFGWGAFNAFRWICIGCFSAYGVVSLWYLVQFREAFRMQIVGPPAGYAVLLFVIAMVEFGILAVLAHYGPQWGKTWFNNRNRWR